MGSMVELFFFISIVGGVMSYYSLDPMKSSFFLILSMLMIMPLMSLVTVSWFSYFVCLLFLSGIFVILVYFSSLSSFGMGKVYLVLLGFLLTICFFFYNVGDLMVLVGLNVFYYKLFWSVLMYILVILLIFMNFTSYFLSFSGALRKI